MTMIKQLILCSIAFLFLNSAFAQSTTVSATVVDQSSTVWANGSWKLDLVPNPNAGSQQVFWNGSTLPATSQHFSGVLDGSGAFSQSVPSTNFMSPSGATYTITVCPNASSTCSVITRQTIQGSTTSLSSIITALTPAPQVLPLPLARAYNDSQVNVSPSQVGYFYLRVSDNQPRYYGQDGAWHSFITGVSSFQTGNLSPLFTATPSTPNSGATTLAYQLSNAAANTVFANCTGAGGAPSYCALTLAMLPTGINAASATALNTVVNCSGVNYAKGMSTSGTFSCSPVNFNELAGNIAVTQMNNGTAASTTTFWRGDGTWSVIPNLPAVEESFTDTACTPATSTDANCSAIANLPTTMPNTGYQVSITMFSSAGASLGAAMTSKSTTQIGYNVYCTFNCGSYGTVSADIIARHP